MKEKEEAREIQALAQAVSSQSATGSLLGNRRLHTT
jgi:hypothetical protein